MVCDNSQNNSKTHKYLFKNGEQHLFGANGMLSQSMSLPTEKLQIKFEISFCKRMVSTVHQISMAERLSFEGILNILNQSVCTTNRKNIQRRNTAMELHQKMTLFALLKKRKGRMGLKVDVLFLQDP